MVKFQKALGYDDIGIAPRNVSKQPHRDGDTSVACFGIKLDYPLIASPMPDVCNGRMAHKLASIGSMGIIHRFQTIDEQLQQYKFGDGVLIGTYPINQFKPNYCACAIGVTGDYQERFIALYKAGCRAFCLDTANGANIMVEKAIRWIREWHKNSHPIDEPGLKIPYLPDFVEQVYIIAGNVATGDGYRFLAELPIDAIRVGISVGSRCTTKNKTGVYVPIVTSILECVEERQKLWQNALDSDIPTDALTSMRKMFPLIIADGGIKEPSDANKALALGADLVMAGSIFVPYDESPAEIVKYEGLLYKKYRGAASFGVQKEYTGENPKFSEGDETLIRYERNVSVSKMIVDFKSGLQSSMSYLNAANLKEYCENADFVGL